MIAAGEDKGEEFQEQVRILKENTNKLKNLPPTHNNYRLDNPEQRTAAAASASMSLTSLPLFCQIILSWVSQSDFVSVFKVLVEP